MAGLRHSRSQGRDSRKTAQRNDPCRPGGVDGWRGTFEGNTDETGGWVRILAQRRRGAESKRLRADDGRQRAEDGRRRTEKNAREGEGEPAVDVEEREMLYLDTSALAKLYVREAETAVLARHVAGQMKPLPFSALHELELMSALQRRMAAGDLNQAANDRIFRDIERDLGAGVLVRPEIDWAGALADAILLIRKHGSPFGLRSLDAVHLACARALKCGAFVTYDSRQAAAAQAESLSVMQPR
jgi:uncharacterized protein